MAAQPTIKDPLLAPRKRQIVARLDELKLATMSRVVYEHARRWGFRYTKVPHGFLRCSSRCVPGCAAGAANVLGALVAGGSAAFSLDAIFSYGPQFLVLAAMGVFVGGGIIAGIRADSGDRFTRADADTLVEVLRRRHPDALDEFLSAPSPLRLAHLFRLMGWDAPRQFDSKALFEYELSASPLEVARREAAEVILAAEVDPELYERVRAAVIEFYAAESEFAATPSPRAQLRLLRALRTLIDHPALQPASTRAQSRTSSTRSPWWWRLILAALGVTSSPVSEEASPVSAVDDLRNTVVSPLSGVASADLVEVVS